MPSEPPHQPWWGGFVFPLIQDATQTPARSESSARVAEVVPVLAGRADTNRKHSSNPREHPMSTVTDIPRHTLQSQLAAVNADVEGIASEFKVDEKGRFDLSRKQFTDYRTKVAEAKELKSLLAALDDADDISAFLNEDERVPTSAADAGRGRMEAKSLGDMFIDSAEYKALRSGGLDGWRGEAVRAEMEGKSIYNLSAGSHTIPALGGGTDVGLIEDKRRKFHVRDLFPKASTKDSVLYGVRETGFTNNAGIVKQRNAGNTDWAAEPGKSEIHLETVLFPVAEIAHTITAHKNVLADEPRLKSFVNTRMIEGVKFKEDFELLWGTGGTEAITGIANTPGVQAYTGLAADKFSIQVRRSITKALLAEYDPTGLVVNPQDWETLEIETDDNGAFRVAIQVAIGAQKRIWRVAVTETTAMQSGKYLLGSFGMGAQLYDREHVSVQVSSEHADNFAKGLVTFRGANRVALEVTRPESFVVGTFTNYVAPV